ncbi:MAG: TnpV protein [Oscillospiraceae bacterium]|nr:TnpV protein [Oscillospiraceae bacterium]
MSSANWDLTTSLIFRFQPIGVWSQRHKRYLENYRPALYNALLLSGVLPSYLADIDRQAQKRSDTIIQQIAQAQGVTETLKAADQMAWPVLFGVIL